MLITISESCKLLQMAEKGGKFTLKRIPVILFTSLISACLFLAAGFLSGAGGDYMLLLCSALYSVLQFFLLQSESIKICLAKIGFTIIFEAILQYLSMHYRWFYYIFIYENPRYGAPNAGSGFAVLVSYFMNAFIFTVLSTICIVKNAKKNNNDV